MEAYQNKGRLAKGMGEIEQYRMILEKDVFQSDEPH